MHAHAHVHTYACLCERLCTCTQQLSQGPPLLVDGGLLDVVQSLNERYNMAPKGTSAEPSYHRSGVFARVGLMEIDPERKSWINHRSTGTLERFTKPLHKITPFHQNITSFSFLRSDILSNGLYGKEDKVSERIGTIMVNHLFRKGGMFEILCAYPTDGGSVARRDSGCGSYCDLAALHLPQCAGQCSKMEPPVTDPKVWIARMNSGQCVDYFDHIPLACSISEAEFDSLFVPVAQEYVGFSVQKMQTLSNNEIVVHMPPLVSLAAFPVEAFFHICGEPPSSTLIRTIAEYKRVLGLQHVPLVCVRMVRNDVFADGASPFEPSPYHTWTAQRRKRGPRPRPRPGHRRRGWTPWRSSRSSRLHTTMESLLIPSSPSRSSL